MLKYPILKYDNLSYINQQYFFMNYLLTVSFFVVYNVDSYILVVLLLTIKMCLDK